MAQTEDGSMDIIGQHNMTKEVNFEGTSNEMSGVGVKELEGQLWTQGVRLKVSVSDGDVSSKKLLREYRGF